MSFCNRYDMWERTRRQDVPLLPCRSDLQQCQHWRNPNHGHAPRICFRHRLQHEYSISIIFIYLTLFYTTEKKCLGRARSGGKRIQYKFNNCINQLNQFLKACLSDFNSSRSYNIFVIETMIEYIALVSSWYKSTSIFSSMHVYICEHISNKLYLNIINNKVTRLDIYITNVMFTFIIVLFAIAAIMV